MSLLLLFHPGVAAGTDVVQYVTPRSYLVGSSPTISPSVLTGSGNVAETGGGADALADANLEVNATTGIITAIDGSGITPLGTYSFELDRNGGTPFTLVVHVVATLGGGSSSFAASSVAQSALAQSSFARSSFG